MKRLALLAPLALLAGCAGVVGHSHLAAPHQSDVIFPTDEAVMTPDVQHAVAQLAADAKSENPSRIMIEGRAGSASPHDLARADARAAIVIRTLVDDGVATSTIQRHPSAPPPGWEGPAAHQVVVTFLP